MRPALFGLLALAVVGFCKKTQRLYHSCMAKKNRPLTGFFCVSGTNACS